MKNAVFWDVTPCGFCKNRCFGGTYRFHRPGDENQRARKNVRSNCQLERTVLQLLVTANGMKQGIQDAKRQLTAWKTVLTTALEE
jgi:hypothetical protein